MSKRLSTETDDRATKKIAPTEHIKGIPNDILNLILPYCVFAKSENGRKVVIPSANKLWNESSNNLLRKKYDELRSTEYGQAMLSVYYLCHLLKRDIIKNFWWNILVNVNSNDEKFRFYVTFENGTFLAGVKYYISEFAGGGDDWTEQRIELIIDNSETLEKHGVYDVQGLENLERICQKVLTITNEGCCLEPGESDIYVDEKEDCFLFQDETCEYPLIEEEPGSGSVTMSMSAVTRLEHDGDELPFFRIVKGMF